MFSAWFAALFTAVIGIGCAVVAVFAQVQLYTRRIMLVFGLAMVGLFTGIQIGLVHAHLDLPDGQVLGSPALSEMAIGVLAGIVIGMLGASLLGDYRIRAVTSMPPARDLPRTPTPEVFDERLGVSWTVVLIVWAIAVASGIGVSLMAGDWWLLALFLPLGLFTAALLRYRVIVDADGVRVLNMGMVGFAYSIDEIAGANVTTVNPFGQFGGWGLRVRGPGDYGVVTKKGPSVVITMATGDKLTITTEHAETVAGSLNTYADRLKTP